MNKTFFVMCMLALMSCEQSQNVSLVKEKKPAGDKQVSGRVLNYGIYTLLRGGKVVDDPKTTTGKSVTKPVITRDRTTDKIPLIKDKYMAYHYRLSNLPGRTVKLRRVLTHPVFQLPDGTTSAGSDFTINKKLERGEVFAYDAYAFNEEYEMVEGEWTFQIWYKDKKLIEQTFVTYWPDETQSSAGLLPTGKSNI
jgi:Domain of unknown function (DUF3859)